MANIGRNDPCPCGSGRKFKHCCLHAALMQQAARVPMERVPGLLKWLKEFMDPAWVSKQLQTFQRYQEAPVRVLTIDEFHPFMRGLAEAASPPATQSPSRPLMVSPAATRAASHAYDLQLLGLHLPSILRSASLLSRLKSSRGDAESLLFELAVGVHYLLQGCGVELPELARLGNTDVLVKWRSEAVEIQCKRKAPGSGRKVPNPLFERLVASVADAWSSAHGTFAIVVKCAERLSAAELPILAAEINSRLATGWQGKTDVRGDAYSLLIEKKGPSGRRVPAETLILELAPFFSDPARPPHIAIIDKLPIELADPAAPVPQAYFVCSSRQRDDVLDNVMQSCREGARQLTGTRPGIVAVHLPEPMTQVTLDRMAMPTALGDALEREFDDCNRSLSKAAAVVISGENLWPFQQGEWWAGFPGIMFRNHSARPMLPDDYPVLGKPSRRGQTC